VMSPIISPSSLQHQMRRIGAAEGQVMAHVRDEVRLLKCRGLN